MAVVAEIILAFGCAVFVFKAFAVLSYFYAALAFFAFFAFAAGFFDALALFANPRIAIFALGNIVRCIASVFVAGIRGEVAFFAAVAFDFAVRIIDAVVVAVAIVFVGYGRNFCAKSEKKIATIPVGYADGYPRFLSNPRLSLFLASYFISKNISYRVLLQTIHLPDVYHPKVNTGKGLPEHLINDRSAY